ncbi:hypothetical protein J6590_077555, partial [Homalodisca vitripennis]
LITDVTWQEIPKDSKPGAAMKFEIEEQGHQYLQSVNYDDIIVYRCLSTQVQLTRHKRVNHWHLLMYQYTTAMFGQSVTNDGLSIDKHCSAVYHVHCGQPSVCGDPTTQPYLERLL